MKQITRIANIILILIVGITSIHCNKTKKNVNVAVKENEDPQLVRIRVHQLITKIKMAARQGRYLQPEVENIHYLIRELIRIDPQGEYIHGKGKFDAQDQLGIENQAPSNYKIDPKKIETLYLESQAMAKHYKEVFDAPDNPTKLIQLAKALMNQSKFYQAEYIAQAALAIDPKHIEALKLIGDIFFNLDQKDKTKHYWQRALDISPSDSVLQKKLALLK